MKKLVMTAALAAGLAVLHPASAIAGPKLGLLQLPIAAAAPAKAPADRLLGKWREEQEFGATGQKPEAKRPVLEFAKGTYVHTYPASGGAPMEGKWQVGSASGNEVVVKMTLKLDAKTEFAADDQKIVFKDDNTIEIRNSQNGQGGLYKRLP